MRPLLARLTLAALVVSSTGCAAIFKGDKSVMHVNGLGPNDQIATLDGTTLPHEGERVKMPSKLPPSYGRLTVTTAQGKHFVVNPRRYVGATWIVLDIVGGLLTGFIPVLVDGVAETWHEYDDVKLPLDAPQPSAPAASPPGAAPAGREAPGGDPNACRAARDYERRAAEASGEERALLKKLAEGKAAECRERPHDGPQDKAQDM
ncbi:MAG TPA: hypothetical protein VFS00_18640 [Polyangiaceae bacterium]|nr:hypothetical protein [Polyangiaceae bacterium]